MSITSALFAGARASRHIKDINSKHTVYLKTYPQVAPLFRKLDMTKNVSLETVRDFFCEIVIAHQGDNVIDLILETSSETGNKWLEFSDYFWLQHIAVAIGSELDIERRANETDLACKDVVEEYLSTIKIK
jgi:hypothetical protein